MKRFIKSEKFIYIVIAVAFLSAFVTVYIKTQHKLDIIRKSEPIVIHDVTTEKGEEKERTVYVTPSGKKYHLDGCKFVGEKRMEISLTDAINTGHEACKYCQP